MNMTYDQYIQNPMGIKNAVFSKREMFRTMYKDKLDKILVREAGKVEYKLYQNKKEDKYYVHMKVPSEVIANFYYDVVIEFYPQSSTDTLSTSLSNYFVKFYSNDPAFVFTFAHAMYKNDLFVKDLIPKMAREALRNLARERNPKDEIGYVKSIFFAYLLMKNYSLFNKLAFKTTVREYNKVLLLADVMQAEDKVELRQQAQNDLNKKHKMDSIANQISRTPGRDQTRSSTNSNLFVKTVSSVSSIGSKTSKGIRKTSRTKRI